IENASDDDTLRVLQERDDIQFLMAQAGFANEYLTLKSTKYLKKQTDTVNSTVTETTSELSGLPTLKNLI
ncbi:unnamed protein product, partial [Porites lobata]